MFHFETMDVVLLSIWGGSIAFFLVSRLARAEKSEDAFRSELESGLRQFAIGIQTRQLRTRARAAGRTVVSLAGAKDEVLAVSPRRGAEQFDVVDFATVIAGDAFAL